MKRIFILMASLALVACAGSNVVIPDISSVDESTAKTLLSQKTLIPSIEYEFSDSVEKGLVIKTDPIIGSTVKQDEKVKIWISKGPRKITSSASSVEWESGADKFEFYAPYIEDGILIIDSEMTFSKKYELKDYEKTSEGYGRASITDTFAKTVPLAIETDDKIFSANTLESFKIKIPVNDLDVQKPTTIYIEFYLTTNEYTMNFSISW
jgi:hypothetical protein